MTVHGERPCMQPKSYFYFRMLWTLIFLSRRPVYTVYTFTELALWEAYDSICSKYPSWCSPSHSIVSTPWRPMFIPYRSYHFIIRNNVILFWCTLYSHRAFVHNSVPGVTSVLIFSSQRTSAPWGRVLSSKKSFDIQITTAGELFVHNCHFLAWSV